MQPRCKNGCVNMSRLIKILAGIVISVAVIIGLYYVLLKVAPIVYFAMTPTDSTLSYFPDIKQGSFSMKQLEIIEAAKREWDDPKDALIYSEGNSEPWCADFVSYVYHEAGQSFKNPNSNSWRIPGTHTLREYFESTGRWYDKDSDYTPKPADVVIYQNGLFGEHTNIVLNVDGEYMTTIGGNENHKVQLRKFEYKNPLFGLVGYGENK